MKLLISVAASLSLLLMGCGVDRGNDVAQQSVVPTEEVSREMYALGTEVTAWGAVPKDAAGETFRRGREIYLSVNVRSASTDQEVEVKWVDPSGRVIGRDARHADRATDYVPFSSGDTSQWAPGAYRAVVVIDGRSVSEKSFVMM